MKVIDIINAKESLAKLNKMKFADFKIVSNVYKLTKKANNVLEMVQQEQQKIVSTYASKDDNGNAIIKDNQYQFEDAGARNDFIREIEGLKQSEVDDVEKIDIQIDKIQQASDLTSAEMLILEPLVNWIY